MNFMNQVSGDVQETLSSSSCISAILQSHAMSPFIWHDVFITFLSAGIYAGSR